MLRGIAWGSVTEEWVEIYRERAETEHPEVYVRKWTPSQLCMCAQQGAQINPGQAERGHCSV